MSWGGRSSGTSAPIHLLLTHLHLDHVEGLGFFAPFWEPGAELHIWGPSSPLHTLEERISRYLSPPLFPLKVADSPAQVHFHTFRRGLAIGSATISAGEVLHPGPTLGYRIEEGGLRSRTSPTTSPRSASSSSRSPRNGFRATGSRRARPCSCTTRS